jgi:chemotaxis protein CheD
MASPALATPPYPSSAHLSDEVRIHVVQGEQYVTTAPNVMLTTILGSCVAACMRDPVAGIGGMNHFLLPGGAARSSDSERYGVHAMELLVNALLREGARRDRLEAKLFGGGRMLRGLTDVGELNATFATDFLTREGIRSTGGSLRGDLGRRVQFWPVSGRARQTTLQPAERVAIDKQAQRRTPAPSSASGDLELF